MVVLHKFELIEKTQMTHDIYELIFEGEKDMIFQNGQFITFLLTNIGGRAYSILKVDSKKITLIVKKREIDSGGRGGSKLICELEVGEYLSGVGPAGHFLLNTTENNKLFLGTGTGFVPLYNQIKGSLEKKVKGNLMLIFGLRTNEDLFYVDELKELKKNNSNFDFKIYLSRGDGKEFEKGYVTDYLTLENIKKFDEYYICGIPGMIKSSREILDNNGINNENVFTEEY